MHYQTSGGSRSSQEVLMRLQSGDPFFTSVQEGKGKMYLCASPLDEAGTNFPRHALFVPVMLKAAMSGFNTFQPSQVVGRQVPVEIPNMQLTGDQVVHLLNRQEKFDVIPEIRTVNNTPVMDAYDQVRKSGNYTVESDGKILSVISYNFDRRESDLAAFNEDELRAKSEQAGLHSLTLFDASKELTHTVTQMNEGTRLWKYCIWLALFFLACEIALIRLMKPGHPKPTLT
jgi:hypothetical protein